jgi:hypothetical protein
MGAEDDVKAGRRQHTVLQRGDQHRIGNLLQVGDVGGCDVLTGDMHAAASSVPPRSGGQLTAQPGRKATAAGAELQD